MLVTYNAADMRSERSYRGRRRSYHPRMLLGILVYGYATGDIFEPEAGAGDL